MFEFDDMPEWEQYVHFPNFDDLDWRAHAEADLNPEGVPIDRGTYVVSYGIGNGPYERIAALIGFENTLMALAEYPEDTKRLADFCTQKNPFFSPEAYREVFLPVNKRYYEGIRDAGIIPVQHTCGYATPIADMTIESGAAGWASVQPCNDVKALEDKYGDRFTFIGGYDTVGPCSLPSATDEQIAEEACRCIREYGRILGPAGRYTHEWADEWHKEHGGGAAA